MSAKPLLVGELNPYGADPAFALYPWPRGSAGWRLARLVLSTKRKSEYLGWFDRANLCTGKWSLPAARMESAVIMSGPLRPLVLLGAKVCAAFDVDYAKSVFGRGTIDRKSMRALAVQPVVIVLPHPSGRCRAWNAPGAYERARAVLRGAGVLPTPTKVGETA